MLTKLTTSSFLKKVKNWIGYDPAIALLGKYLKKPETLIQKDKCTPNVHCNIIYNNSQSIEATQVPINEQVDKKDVVHTYNGILFGH